MSLTRLSITCSHPPVSSEGVPEPTQLSDRVQKTEVSTGSTQWAASWHKPSGNLADFLFSNYIHHFWWQLHEMKNHFYFHSTVTKWAHCYGSLWFGIQGQELRYKRREQAVISLCKHRVHSASIICVCHLWHFAKSFGGLQEEVCCLYHRMEHQIGCYSPSW